MLSLTLVSLLLPALSAVVRPVAASPCIAMDTSFNLLVFGVDGKDYNAGTQDSWTSGTASDITATGRPPFDGSNTTCYLAQFFNAVYVLNGDASNPTDVYIYDATAKSWTTQTVKAADVSSFDLTSLKAILDHDTNVFYAMSKGEIFFLDMKSLTAASSDTLTWGDAGASSWGDLSSYEPVMAIAQNHIHFIGVPGLQAGQADIFVIHFSYFQPEAQSYSSDFPETHGQAVSFFQDSGVQQEFAFVPDDGSATYVINVETNTTQTLAGPSTKDAGAQYFAGKTSLVQLSSTDGSLAFLPYTQGNDNSGAKWTSITAVSVPSSSSTASGSLSNGTSSSGSGKGNSTSTGSASGLAASQSSTTSDSGAGHVVMNVVGMMAGVAALTALLL